MRSIKVELTFRCYLPKSDSSTFEFFLCPRPNGVGDDYFLRPNGDTEPLLEPVLLTEGVWNYY